MFEGSWKLYSGKYGFGKWVLFCGLEV